MLGSFSGKASGASRAQNSLRTSVQVHCKNLLCARASRSTAGSYCRFGRMWFRHGCACRFLVPKYQWVLITIAEIDYRQFLVTFQLVIISKLSSECWLLHLIFCLLFISWLSQHEIYSNVDFKKRQGMQGLTGMILNVNYIKQIDAR